MRRLLLVLVLPACIVQQAPARQSPPPPPPSNTGTGPAPSCAAGGTALFVQRQWAIHQNPPPNEPPGQTITIMDTGAWQVGGENAASGCLTADQLTTVRARLARPPAKTPPGGIHCMMTPLHHFDATFGGGTIEWDAPCQPGPDDPSERAIDCARDLTVSRASPTGACAAPTSP